MVSGSAVVAGDDNQVSVGTHQPEGELGGLLKEIRALREALAAADLDPDYKAMVIPDLEQAEAAAQKERPKPPLITGPIEAVKAKLQQILDAGGKVEALIPMAQKLGELAARIGLALG